MLQPYAVVPIIITGVLSPSKPETTIEELVVVNLDGPSRPEDRQSPVRSYLQSNSVVAKYVGTEVVLSVLEAEPYIETSNQSVQLEHEASTSKISEDQLFYFEQRGISRENAINAVINGFCKEVFKQLPMEFAVEAQKLLTLKLENSVG